MKWLRRTGVALAALVAVLAIVPYFVRLNDRIPALEKEISARIGEPVSIKNLHVALLPAPHARADEITIGDAEKIQVGKLTVFPELLSLLREEKVIRKIELQDLTLPHQSFAALAALTQGDRSVKVRIETIRLENAVVKFEKSAFGPFDVDVQVSGAGQQAGHLTLKTRDGKVRADVTPQRERFVLDIAAHGWTPPLGPPIVFEELSVKGSVDGKTAELEPIEAKIYGGSVTGKTSIAWGKGIAVKGALEVKRVELRDALAVMSPKSKLSGKVSGKPVFSTQADKATQLDETLKVETPFTVAEGVLHGVDLMTAATSLGKSTSGGDTRFDQLAGHLRIDGKRYYLNDLRIASGPLAVRGDVQVSPTRALSGKINANANGFGRMIGVPLIVSGTLESPQVLPDTRALAAAAAGTALLGPGLGTAAGAKLGDVVDGLFGQRRRR